MKNFYTLLICLFLFTSCTDPALKKLRKMSQKAEKAQIYFYEKVNEKQEPDTLTHSLQKETVNSFLTNISKKSSPDYACHADGMIKIITEDSNALSVNFTLDQSCSHVNFRLNGYTYSKVIDQKGLEQLQTFKAKTSLK